MAHDTYGVCLCIHEPKNLTTTVATTATATVNSINNIDEDSGDSSIQQSQSYFYTSRRHSLIRYCVCEFQISQLIRLLIRDKQTNPFKYQTVLIGASRTYGSVFGFSLWTQTQTTWFSVREHIPLQTCLRWLRETKNKHMYNKSTTNHTTATWAAETIYFFYSPFFSTFDFLALFYCQFFRLLLVLLCFAFVVWLCLAFV